MIYIFLYLFLEVIASTYFASMLGGLYTFLVIIITAFIGGFLLKNFKYSLMLNIKSFTKGEITQEDFIKQNVANAIGAILLILPGFLTDIIGILLQFGILTRILTKIFKFKIAPKNLIMKIILDIKNNNLHTNKKGDMMMKKLSMLKLLTIVTLLNINVSAETDIEKKLLSYEKQRISSNPAVQLKDIKHVFSKKLEDNWTGYLYSISLVYQGKNINTTDIIFSNGLQVTGELKKTTGFDYKRLMHPTLRTEYYDKKDSLLEIVMQKIN